MDQIALTGDDQSILSGRGLWCAHEGFDCLVGAGCLHLGYNLGAGVDGEPSVTSEVSWDSGAGFHYH